jgi:LmbE family N-acetylglucosaminyl deacetylase
MYRTVTAMSIKDKRNVFYRDYLSKEWVRVHAPCRWHGNVELRFRSIRFAQLEPAASRKRPQVVTKWLAKLETREPIPPMIASLTQRGTYYVHEGNHRHEAMRLFLGASSPSCRIRVAVVAPRYGFCFRYRWFGTYGTYLLEPQVSSLWPTSRKPGRSRGLEPLLHRTLVIASHPDDETACAALLQRMRDPRVVFLTDGAPATEFFWQRHGSRKNYAAVRQTEATNALSMIRITSPYFLSDSSRSRPFSDQELYRCLGDAIAELVKLTERVRPDALLVPAYEGGHPDHDVCSFLGHVVGARLHRPVWEMPLYHRSSSGDLVHQQFLDYNGTEVVVEPTRGELIKQQAMVAAYGSQSDLQQYLMARIECYRPQLAYDYSRPPHPWPLNYECWHWPMTGMDVSNSFTHVTQRESATLACSCRPDCMDPARAAPSIEPMVRVAQTAAYLGGC